MKTMAGRLRTILHHIQSEDGVYASPVSGLQTVGSGSYNYTLDSPILTEEQRKFYEKNGFLVIKNLVPKNDLDTYRQHFERICKREVSVPMLTIMRDVAIKDSEYVPGQQAVTKIQNFQLDDVLFEYCKHPQVVKYVEAFVGPNINAVHTMLINKPPDPGKKSSRHPLHQDLHYFPFRPADRIVCSWTAMQTVNRANGCLVVQPGTHKGNLLEHGYPQWEGGVNHLYHGIMQFDPDAPRHHLEMEAGDTVFFHPLLIHGSGMNKTNDFRKSISCHYASADCYFVDITGTIQEAAVDEVYEMAIKKGAKTEQLDITKMWKLKSRLVKGVSDWK